MPPRFSYPGLLKKPFPFLCAISFIFLSCAFWQFLKPQYCTAPIQAQIKVVAVLKIAKVIAFITQNRSQTHGVSMSVPQKTSLSWKTMLASIEGCVSNTVYLSYLLIHSAISRYLRCLSCTTIASLLTSFPRCSLPPRSQCSRASKPWCRQVCQETQ